MIDKAFVYLFYMTGFFTVLGVSEMPFTYYTFVRGLVSVSAVMLGVLAIRTKQYGWLALSLASFLFFFPLFEVELDRKTWMYIDVVVGVAYFAAARTLAKNPRDDG